jgi:hypothetical protein
MGQGTLLSRALALGKVSLNSEPFGARVQLTGYTPNAAIGHPQVAVVVDAASVSHDGLVPYVDSAQLCCHPCKNPNRIGFELVFAIEDDIVIDRELRRYRGWAATGKEVRTTAFGDGIADTLLRAWERVTSALIVTTPNQRHHAQRADAYKSEYVTHDNLSALTAPTRLVTQPNWVVMGCAAIRISFLLSGRKVCVRVHSAGVMEGFGFSPIDPRPRSICASVFRAASHKHPLVAAHRKCDCRSREAGLPTKKGKGGEQA